MLRLVPLLALLAAAPAWAQKPKPGAAPEAPTSDARVEAALDADGVVYTQEENGDYRMLFEMADERSHLVWVSPVTFSYGSIEVREVFATGFEFEGGVPAGVAEQLMKENLNYILGSWALSGDRVLFVAKVDADAGPEELGLVMSAVLGAADEFESTVDGGADDW